MMKGSTILGIWDGHDSGAALIHDGIVRVAVNEERFTRRKMEVHFPVNAISHCICAVGISPRDIDRIAYTTTDFSLTLTRCIPAVKDSYYYVRRKIRPARFPNLNRKILNYTGRMRPNRITGILSDMKVQSTLKKLGLAKIPLSRIEHHHAHAASAFFTSGMQRALVVTMDGLGDGLSATVYRGEGSTLERLAEVKTRDSLGLFYQEVTSLLGMRILEDEGKVMALADHAGSLGEKNPMRGLFEKKDGRVRARMGPERRYWYLKRLSEEHPPHVFARMAQETLEYHTARFIGTHLRRTGLRNLCLAGGLFSNVKNNRNIIDAVKPIDWYVFPHMGDGGLAVGAGLAASSIGNKRKTYALKDVKLGPSFSSNEIRNTLERYSDRIEWEYETNCSKVAADAIIQGEVVFWFQGAMEYGPRALGSRSILANPEDMAVKDRLNSTIKRRQWYQPFCPSILRSDAYHLFEPCVRSDPCMTMAYRITKQGCLKGVRDNNGCCRPQIIPDTDKAAYTRLLKEMKRRTGIGAVLNTSFNIHGEPIVTTPEEALDVFLRTDEGILVIGEYVVRRK